MSWCMLPKKEHGAHSGIRHETITTMQCDHYAICVNIIDCDRTFSRKSAGVQLRSYDAFAQMLTLGEGLHNSQ